MSDAVLITQECAINRAKINQTAFAAAKLRFVKNFTPLPTSTRADLLANEADFTGYTSGGYALATWTGPALPLGGGAVITAPTTIVAPTDPTTVTNSLTAWWVETSGTPPEVVMVGTFDPARDMLSSFNQFPFAPQDFSGLPGVAPPG